MSFLLVIALIVIFLILFFSAIKTYSEELAAISLSGIILCIAWLFSSAAGQWEVESIRAIPIYTMDNSQYAKYASGDSGEDVVINLNRMFGKILTPEGPNKDRVMLVKYKDSRSYGLYWYDKEEIVLK